MVEGPFAGEGDRLRMWAVTASIRGQKPNGGGPLSGVLYWGLTIHHLQNYPVTKYYTHRHIWDDNTQKWVFRNGIHISGLDSSVLGQAPVADSCEHVKEPYA